MMKIKDPETGKEIWLHETQELKSDLFNFREYKCQHVERKTGYVEYSNGSRHLRLVCLDCGEFIGDSLRNSTNEDYQKIDDQGIKERFLERRTKQENQIYRKHVRIQRKNSKDGKIKYVQYISSKEWAAKREKVILRAGGICEGCGDAKIEQVHHKTYDRLYNEMLFDLAGLCDKCHRICHPEFLEEQEDDDVFDDLPCYGCRHFGGGSDGEQWCTVHGMHVIAALSDKQFCGPRARSLEGLK